MSVTPFEALIVFVIVVAWLCSIVMFVKRWNKIRISPPVESRFKPKNIHRIKVGNCRLGNGFVILF